MSAERATEPEITPSPAPVVDGPPDPVVVVRSRVADWRDWVLPFTAVIALRYVIPVEQGPQQPPWLATFVFAAALAGQVAWMSRRPVAAEGAVKSRVWVAFLLAATVFIARAGWRHDLYPIYLFSESAVTLNHARNFEDAPPQAMEHVVRMYNWGLGPPFSVLPAEWRTMEGARWFAIVIFAGAVAALLAVVHRASRLSGLAAPLLLTLLPAAVCSFALVSQRRYKWHLMALVAGVASYAVLLALRDERHRRLLLRLALPALIVSVLLYHGALLVVPALVLALAVESLCAEPDQRRQPLLWAVMIGSVLATVVALVAAYPSFTYFAERIAVEANDARPEFSRAAKALRNWRNSFDALFVWGFSLPLSAVLFAGIAASLATFRARWLSRAHVCLFAGAFGLLMITYGLENPDENHFVIAPILGLLTAGLVELGRLARGTAASFVLAILLVGAEVYHYDAARLWGRLDAHPHPLDPGYPLILALRDARAVASRDGVRPLFFLHQGIPETDEANKQRALVPLGDFRAVHAHLRWYQSSDDLASQLQRILVHERHATIVRVYVDEGFDAPGVVARLGSLPEYSAVVVRTLPHAHVWRVEVPLRYIEFLARR